MKNGDWLPDCHSDLDQAGHPKLQFFITIYQVCSIMGLAIMIPIVLTKIKSLPYLADKGVIEGSVNQLSKDQSISYQGKKSILWAIHIGIVVYFVVSSDAELHLGSLFLSRLHLFYAIPVIIFDITTAAFYAKCFSNEFCAFPECFLSTICSQIFALYIGWIFPLFIAFPVKVGTLISMLIIGLVSIIVITSGFMFIAFPFIMDCIRFRRLLYVLSKFCQNENFGIGLLLLSTLCLTKIYYYTKGNKDDGSGDSITTIAIGFLPTILIGFSTWIYKKYITIDHSEILFYKGESENNDEKLP